MTIHRNDQGQRHREDGPAVERANGDREWWVNGQLHRTDGPAVEYVNGTREWWVNDQLHRTDGPAFERANGEREWWVNDQRMTEKRFNAWRAAAALTTGEANHKDKT